ncbi:glycosyl hydrolase, family 31 [Microscilla marina ATCC 23134]|uniref:Glycosyl hydrolase, family 31 n=2 Tax=Microscilla marina TaxID=1027 RepID=A1ZWA9_MICM2|nr:glycosyl hydrolase, family 31 [Microscilla marina ATCC 23134]
MSGSSQALKTGVIEIACGEGTYTIAALTNNVIKVSYQDTLTSESKQYAAVLSEPIAMQLEEQDNHIVAKTQGVKLEITRSPFSINFCDEQTGSKLKGGEFSRKEGIASFKFGLKNHEAMYGMGSRGMQMNRRGHKLLNYNSHEPGNGMGFEVMNYSIPHLASSEQYMLLFDNPARAWMDIGKTQTDALEYTSEGGNMVYYFVNGQSFEELMGEYTQLTGKQPLPPLWAMGYIQSRFGYRTQQEATEELDKLLEAGYPVDAMILDLYWFSDHEKPKCMGNLDFNQKHWPKPKEMIQYFASKGVKTIPITEPFFTTNSDHYKDLRNNELLVKNRAGEVRTLPEFFWGEAALLDIFKPEAQAWMWERYKYMKQYGFDGWWVDLCEPEIHPEDMVHVNGKAAEVHGIFGHQWAQMLFEGYAKDYPEERVFQLSRAGFAGSQRFGVVPWSGDVRRSWDGLKAQPLIMLSVGMSGIGYMHSDAGGFIYGEKDPELYTRWMQYAVFTPVVRPHACGEIYPEPTFWSEEVQNHIKLFINLRYQLLPYNYTLAWKNSVTGMPLARPLFTQFANVPDTVEDQYMWGDSILVAPVLDKGIRNRNVYLPKGNWYDFWNHQFLQGDSTINVGLTMDSIPVYVKSGSIIPTTPEVQSTSFYTGETLQMTYYVGSENSQTQLYFDDGKTNNAYERGMYELVTIAATVNKGEIILSTQVAGKGYGGAPKKRLYVFELIGLAQAPKEVSIAGKALSHEWNQEKNTVSFETDLNDDVIIAI